MVCANACAALAQLLAADDADAPPLRDAGAQVLTSLTDAVHKRLGGLLGVALARFRWAAGWWWWVEGGAGALQVGGWVGVGG